MQVQLRTARDTHPR